MAPRLSGQTSIFGVVFFVSKSLLGIEKQKTLEKFAILTRTPRSHVRILIYRTWPIKQVHIKFCKHSLNVPWYTETIACRAKLGRYSLSIDIKASIFSYWQN